MKKISFKTLSARLSDKEMKNVLGGSGNCCAYHPDVFSSGLYCADSVEAAISGAGSKGWWACNTFEVKIACC